MNPATLRTLFLVAVILFVLWLAYLARAVVTPLLVALLLAYILDPVVRFLERRGLSRAVASGTVVVVALAALVTVAVGAAARFAAEATTFYRDVAGEPYDDTLKRPEFEARLVGEEKDPAVVATILGRVRETEFAGVRIVFEDSDDNGAFDAGYAARAIEKVHDSVEGSRFAAPLDKALTGLASFGPEVTKSAGELLGGVVEGGRAAITGFLGILTMVLLFPIYLYYALVNLARVYEVTVRHLPEGQRDRVVDILGKIHVTLSAFFRGRLITMFVKGLLLLGLFLAFGVPFSFVCALFAALASLVPVLGGVVAGGPPIALSLHDASGVQIAALVAGIVVIEIIEGYVLIPLLIGRQVGLHPLTVLVCALIAGELLGLFGMIVAVPLTAVAKILAAEFVLPEIRRRAGFAAAAPPPAAAPPSDEKPA